jgi:hypothetical protein
MTRWTARFGPSWHSRSPTSGGEREAVAIALAALSEYLPRYNRSLARDAEAL